jgi:hypothetical protein
MQGRDMNDRYWSTDANRGSNLESTSRRTVLRGIVGAGLVGIGATTGISTVSADSEVLDIQIPPEQRTIVNHRAQHFTNADFDQPNIQLLSEGPVQQTLQAELDINESMGTTTVVIDYSETADAGLSIPEGTDIVGDGPLEGAVSNVEIRNSVGEVEVTFDAADTGDVAGQTQNFNLVFSGPVLVEDGTPEHIVSIDGAANSDSSISYRLTPDGATAVTATDALNGGGIDLSEDPSPEEINPDRDGSEAAFSIWQGQQLTFQVEENGNFVEIYEYVVDSNVVRRGSRLRTLGTAPGAVTNFDTSELEAETRYIVQFPAYGDYDAGTDPVVVLDVDPLNLEAKVASEEFSLDEQVKIEVSADDLTGGDVAAFFFDENFESIGTVIEGQLDGNGEATLHADPESDLAGVGDYNSIVIHQESEVTTSPLPFTVVSGGPPPVTGEKPPQDPDDDGLYEDLNGDGTFDIVDVQATLQNYERFQPGGDLEAYAEALDFNQDGSVDIVDVQKLLLELD